MRITPLTGAIALTSMLLAGCGPNEYTPAPGSSAVSIFADVCAGCHGDNGEGKLLGLLKIKGTELGTNEIAAKIAGGSTFMPAFPNIGNAEQAALAQYLKQ
jgi:mono/diheme cytochrome c family protein